MRARGLEPDLRQEGRSLKFAVYPVTSVGSGDDISAISTAMKDHFIAVTAGHTFSSRLKQLTFSPYICAIGPRPKYQFSNSHRWAEDHVFATTVLDPGTWAVSSRQQRFERATSALLTSIELIRDGWLSPTDRADLMGVFLSLRWPHRRSEI